MPFNIQEVLCALAVTTNIIHAFSTTISAFQAHRFPATSTLDLLGVRCNYILMHLGPQQLGEFKAISNEMEAGRLRRRVWLYDFVTNENSTTVPYHTIWDHQKCLLDFQLSRIGKGRTDSPLYEQFLPTEVDLGDANPQNLLGCDSIIMVEHTPVYTLGTASDASFINHDQRRNASIEKVGNIFNNQSQIETRDGGVRSIPVVRIERGGEVTYHGPGQLVVYPILDLRGYKQDVHWYIRALEEIVLLALKKAGVQGATREDGLTGVWVSNKKIAALGIKTRRWVTMHGLAINVDRGSLHNFSGIIPCGLEGREVTCINNEIHPNKDAEGGMTVKSFAFHVQEAIDEIFGISLVPAPTKLMQSV